MPTDCSPERRTVLWPRHLGWRETAKGGLICPLVFTKTELRFCGETGAAQIETRKAFALKGTRRVAVPSVFCVTPTPGLAKRSSDWAFAGSQQCRFRLVSPAMVSTTADPLQRCNDFTIDRSFHEVVLEWGNGSFLPGKWSFSKQFIIINSCRLIHTNSMCSSLFNKKIQDSERGWNPQVSTYWGGHGTARWVPDIEGRVWMSSAMYWDDWISTRQYAVCTTFQSCNNELF